MTPVTAEADPLDLPAEWNSIVSNAKNNGYRRFRIYGNDCGVYDALSRGRFRTNVFFTGTTFDRAAAAAKTYGLPVLIGIWVGGSVPAKLQSFSN